MIWYPGFGLRRLLISITLLVIIPLLYALGLFLLSVMLVGFVWDLLGLRLLVSERFWLRHVMTISWFLLFFVLGYATWVKFKAFMKWFVRKSDLHFLKESLWNLLK
jgi:hypothetical protein